MSIEKALEAQASSPLGYGSEFRKPDTLRPLLQLHPNWERFERLLKNGSDWPLDPISEEDREQDVHEALEFGNHKGAELEPDLLTSTAPVLDDHGACARRRRRDEIRPAIRQAASEPEGDPWLEAPTRVGCVRAVPALGHVFDGDRRVWIDGAGL